MTIYSRPSMLDEMDLSRRIGRCSPSWLEPRYLVKMQGPLGRKLYNRGRSVRVRSTLALSGVAAILLLDVMAKIYAGRVERYRANSLTLNWAAPGDCGNELILRHLLAGNNHLCERLNLRPPLIYQILCTDLKQADVRASFRGRAWLPQKPIEHIQHVVVIGADMVRAVRARLESPLSFGSGQTDDGVLLKNRAIVG